MKPVKWHLKSEASPAFSLVEVTIAIGLFAFVVVAVVGMFPAAMKMRSESALETRAAMIAQELFAAVDRAPSMTNVVLRAGPDLNDMNNLQTIDLQSEVVVVGFPAQTSVPFFMWYNGRSAGTPESAWENGQLPAGAMANDIFFLSRLSATNVTNSLYRVDVQVRAPAAVPRTKSTVLSFSTLQHKP